MQRHCPKPVRIRPILPRRIRLETDDNDRAWDDATLLVGGDDKPTAGSVSEPGAATRRH